MLTDLHIQDFRGIRRAEIPGLRPFSILTGANNCGKSTVLEAAAICATAAAADSEQYLFDVIYTHRGVKGDVQDSLYFADGTQADLKCTIDGESFEIMLKGANLNALKTSDRQSWTKQIAPPTRPTTFYRNKSVCYVAPEQSPHLDHLESAISFAERGGHRKAVMDIVRSVDPSVTDLRILMVDEAPVLHAGFEIDGREVVSPVSVAGSGFKQVLTLVCKLSGATGVVCVDDPEVYLHPRLHRVVAETLWRLVEQGAQVLLATHSLSLIGEIAEHVNGDPRSSQLGLYGLVREHGIVRERLRRNGSGIQVPRRSDALRELLGGS